MARRVRGTEPRAVDESAAREGGAKAALMVFVSAVTGHGGPNASLRLLVPRLRGYSVVLVGPYSDREAAAWWQSGVTVHQMVRPQGARGLAQAMVQLVVIIWRYRRQRPIVFANGLTEAAVLVPSLFLVRSRGLVWVHNSEVPKATQLGAPFLRILARERLRVAAVSQVAAEVGRSVFGRRVEIAYLPNPIEQTKLAAINRPAVTPSRPLRVAYIAGTDRRHKGFDLLPDIILETDGCGLEWLVVAAEATQPEAWRRLREVSESLESSNVSVRGRTDRVEELYEWADIVLIPSRQESFCRVAAEAMAAGVAIVSARLPAIEEVCGDLATYFTAGDSLGAAEALRSIANSVELLVKAERQGRLHARRFDTTSVLERLYNLLNSGHPRFSAS